MSVSYQSERVATLPTSTEVATDLAAGVGHIQRVRLDVGSDGTSEPFPGPMADSFSRMRVSQPQGLFDAQFTYDLHPLLFEQITSGVGASITHDATNRCARLALSSTPSGEARMQTFEHIRYQPGKSQFAFATCVFGAASTGCVKSIGYSEGANGVEFRQAADGTLSIALLSDTANGDEIVAQADWNQDKFDGTGPSGLILDGEKAQIFALDIQALYVGKVRTYFDIGGVLHKAHFFEHANETTAPYIQTASLPIRAAISCESEATGAMDFICCSVMSEGGQEDTSGYSFAHAATGTAGGGARTHIMSIRPRPTFNAITTRAKVVLEAVDILVTGNFPVSWELCFGQTLANANYSNVSTNHSVIQADSAGSLSGSPIIVAARGFCPASAAARSATSSRLSNRYPITLMADGSPRDLGTASLVLTGIGGSSAVQAVLSWRELR